MKRNNAAIVLLAMALAQPVSAVPGRLEALQWMEGTWLSNGADERSEERWTVVPGGGLVGSAWSVPGRGAGFSEAMSVKVRGNDVVMRLRHFDLALTRAWEKPLAPMVFRLAKSGPRLAVFDGEGRQAGEHLTYTRTGNRLRVVGDFLRNGAHRRVEMRFVRR